MDASVKAATTFPTGWRELTISPADVANIKDAFKLLRETFPNRYGNLDVKKLMHKMVPRTNRNVDQVAGLRIWWRVDIAVFFFLRTYPQDNNLEEAYCMTVGVKETVADLYSELVLLCKYMQSLPGSDRIEIVNELDLPANFPTNAKGKVVSAAFTAAAAQLEAPVDIAPKYPWPDNLKSWLIKTL